MTLDAVAAARLASRTPRAQSNDAAKRPVEAEARQADGQDDEQGPAPAAVAPARTARTRLLVVVAVVVLLVSADGDDAANAADARTDFDGTSTGWRDVPRTFPASTSTTSLTDDRLAALRHLRPPLLVFLLRPVVVSVTAVFLR